MHDLSTRHLGRLLALLLLATAGNSIAATEAAAPDDSAPPAGTEQGESARYSTAAYAFSAPTGWRRLEHPSPIIAFQFEGSGIDLPPMHGGYPLMVNVAVLELPEPSLEAATEALLQAYREHPDRVWEEGYQPAVRDYPLQLGGTGRYLATRFFRPSKGMFQNRYDLVTYSETLGKAVVFTVSIQHGDERYDVVETLDFAGRVVEPLFASVSLGAAGTPAPQ